MENCITKLFAMQILKDFWVILPVNLLKTSIAKPLSQYAITGWSKIFQVVRADVCKYRPKACNKENIKILKKIHKVGLGELLTEMYFSLRSDNCFRRAEVVFVSQLSDLAFRVSNSASQKAR